MYGLLSLLKMPSLQKGNRPGTASSKRSSAGGANTDAEHRPSGEEKKNASFLALFRLKRNASFSAVFRFLFFEVPIDMCITFEIWATHYYC